MLVTNVPFNAGIHSEFLSMSYQYQATKTKNQYWELGAGNRLPRAGKGQGHNEDEV